MPERASFSPHVMAAAAVLLVAAVALPLALLALGVHPHKQAAELRRPLYDLPEQFGPFVVIDKRQLSHEIIEEIRTDQYLHWRLQDSRVVRPGAEAQLHLHVEYHTGWVDTTPYVPGRCFLAGPAEAHVQPVEPITLSGGHIYTTADAAPAAMIADGRQVRLPDRRVPVRLFTYRPPRGGEVGYVVTLYMANGRFAADPDDVRRIVTDSHVRSAYWAKVELESPAAPDADAALQVARQCLSHVLPVILDALPDPDLSPSK